MDERRAVAKHLSRRTFCLHGGVATAAAILAACGSGEQPTVAPVAPIPTKVTPRASIAAASPARGTQASETDPRIPVPASTVGAAQGWLTARLRAGWAGTGASGTHYLMRWCDNPDNLLDVRYDKDQWKLRRITAAGVEEVRDAVQEGSGTARTVVAAWTAAGMLLSIDGSAFRAQVMMDNFDRPGSQTVGIARSGQAWTSGVPGSQQSAIIGLAGGMTTSPGVPVYEHQAVAGPPKWMGGTYRWLGINRMDNVALIASRDDRWIDNMVLYYVQYNSYQLSLGDGFLASPTPIILLAGSAPTAQDSTVYEIGMGITGDTITLLLPSGTTRNITDPRIGTLAGGNLTWAIYSHPPGTSGSPPQWERATIEQVTDTPTVNIYRATTIAAPIYEMSGDFAWFASGTGTLTSADVATIAGFGDAPPTMAQLAALNSARAQPTIVRRAEAGTA